MLNKWVEVNYKFRGVHCWKTCSIDIVDFLKNVHHHEFELTVKYEVTDSDRQIEFITEQLVLEKLIHHIFKNYNNDKKVVDEIFDHLYKEYQLEPWEFTPYTADFRGYSCEMICEELLNWLKRIHPYINISLKISEDGHYAGGVEYVETTITKSII